MSELARFIAACILPGLLSGCISVETPRSAAEICLLGPGWRVMDEPPLLAPVLQSSVRDRLDAELAARGSMDYWLESDSGALRLCRQSTSAKNVCGSVTVEFNMQAGKWRAQSGVLVPVCNG